MRLSPIATAAALLAGCAAAPPPPAPAPDLAEPSILRGAELARVRCLLVAPLENASSAPLAADAATGALLSGLSASGARALPVKDLRAVFRDTPVELPEGVPPGLALELAQLLGADAALYGTVEVAAQGGGPGLVVSIRLAVSPQRELLFATTSQVRARPGEAIDAAVRRTVAEASHELFLRLGGPRGGACFDRKRLDALRSYALADAAPKPPPTPPRAPPPVAVAVATPPRPAPPPPTRTLRQKEWAERLRGRQQFIVEDVVFQGRSAILLRDSGLADLAVVLASAPQLRVRLEGNVDATSDQAGDSQLSMAMAQAAAARLAELGVARERIVIVGRGGESPRLPNFTARGRGVNRRLEAVGLE